MPGVGCRPRRRRLPASVQDRGWRIGPFPVRNFNPLQQLVLNMPGDRAVVLKPGTLVYRVGEHWLWQGYGVENIDLTTGGAADFTLPTADLPVSVMGGRFRQTT